MGNGLPLAATAASRSLVEGFRAATRYFNTFASSPLQAAVGMAVIDVIERDKLLESVAAVGAFLKAEPWPSARRASCRSPTCAGHGLFIGVEITRTDADRTPDQDRAVEVINRLKDKGFLTSNAGAFRNVVKIRPPLPVCTAACRGIPRRLRRNDGRKQMDKEVIGQTFTPAAHAALKSFPIDNSGSHTGLPWPRTSRSRPSTGVTAVPMEVSSCIGQVITRSTSWSPSGPGSAPWPRPASMSRDP